ncbi:restriction endonuclease subunit S [Peribacillus frigoritolerans]|nr:restriction endonuclease subunit S [Peribacillus frigoritolerans]
MPENSICVSCIASPGLVAITTALSQTNQQINSINCQKDFNLYYLYFAIRNYFKFSKGAKTGNTFANMSKGDFGSIKIIYPKENILIEFYQRVNSIMEKIKINSKENQELKSLRDFLLPMFVNGQVSFKQKLEVVTNK